MRDCDHACTKPAAQLGQPSSQPLDGQGVCFSIWAADPWAPQRRSFRCWNQQPWSLRGVVQLAKSPSRASWLETKWPRVSADQVGLSLLASAFPLLTSEAARNPNAACKRGRGRLCHTVSCNCKVMSEFCALARRRCSHHFSNDASTVLLRRCPSLFSLLSALFPSL